MTVKARWPGTVARWERLVNTLAEAGITADVDSRVWCDEIVCSITMRVGGGLITISDTAWRDRWTGWQVVAEDAEGIVIRTCPKTKKRSEVRQHVQDARNALTGHRTR